MEYAARPLDERQRIWQAAAEAFAQLAQSDLGGDVLVFMPGAYEINRTLEAIRAMPDARGWTLLPLYGDLPTAEQDRAVRPADRPKVVVATNVAETSITIDGVRAVIDSGLARVSRFDPHRGINTLLIEAISQASAEQRAGRAGRTAPGRCLCLWTEHEHRGRKPHDIPEIHRIDLAEVLLMLKAHGFPEAQDFPWLEAPEPAALQRAEQLLRDLGAADADSGEITALGRRMVAFPLHPRYARMLIAGNDFGCVCEAALIAALTQDRELLIRRVPKLVQEARDDLWGERAPSDFFILMRAWRYAQQHRFELDACRRLGVHAGAARRVAQLTQQFLRVAEQQGLRLNTDEATPEAIQQCVLTAFIDQLAKRRDSGTLRCDLTHARRGELARESAVRQSPLFVAAEIVEIERARQELNVRLHLATAVDEAWLQSLFPEAFSERTEVAYEASGKRVVANRVRYFRELALDVKRGATPPPEEAAALLAREVLQGRLTLKQWTPAVEQWICRLNSLAAWCPELGLPTIDDDDRQFLLQQICQGSYSAKDIRDQPVWPWLKDWLAAGQETLLDEYAPTHLTLPNGRRGRIRYAADAPPLLSARIQDLYDLERTPSVAMQRQALIVEVLGPNQRPLQVTQDLAGFWQHTYPELKQALQKRYPKHEWR